MEDLWQEALAAYRDRAACEADLERQLTAVRETKALTVAAMCSLGRTQDDVAAAIGTSRQRVGQYLATARTVVEARAKARSAA